MDGFTRRPRPSKLHTPRSRQMFEPVLQEPDSRPLHIEEQPLNNGFGGPGANSPKDPKKKFEFKLPVPKNKKQWILFGIVTALILGATGFAVFWFIIRDTTPPVVHVEPVPEPEPAATTGPSRMSGREVPLNFVSKPAYAVQIENSPEARPQSGLMEADIVSEAVAEGGITRFNAIFHDNVPANIGPVRSLRPYYIDWFLPYKAPIVHAGGSPEALNDIKALGIQDMDHGVNAASFRRVSNRYAPHNLYTTGAQMLELFSKKGYTNGEFTSLARKTAEPGAVPNAATVNLKISSANYNVVFTWDPATQTYLRAQGGGPHKDAESGKQVAPNVVVVPVMSKGIHPDRVHTQYGTTGSGDLFVFQDGMVTRGTWTKPSRGAQWQLKDTTGAEIKLNPGQTWFTMIDAAGSVTFQ